MNEILKKLSMTMKEFSKHYAIPYNTVRQWVNGTRKPPDYVIRLLNEKIERESKGEQISIYNNDLLYIIESYTIYAYNPHYSCYDSEEKRAQAIKCFYSDKKLYKYIKTYECYKKECTQ